MKAKDRMPETLLFVAILAIFSCGKTEVIQSKGKPENKTIISSDTASIGTTTSWHLETHEIEINNKSRGDLIADCRGNNYLSWEVKSDSFTQPSKVGVFCGMYKTRPKVANFSGWGWKKTNWPDGDGCTYKTRRKHGESSCNEYFRAMRSHVNVDAPWCQITFHYDKPIVTNYKVITYCVTR